MPANTTNNKTNDEEYLNYLDKRLQTLNKLSNEARIGNLEKTRGYNLSKKYSIGNLNDFATEENKKTDMAVEGPFHPLYDLRNFNNFRSSKELFVTDDIKYRLNQFASQRN